MWHNGCQQCLYSNEHCRIRYCNDIIEFGAAEWLCPDCGQSHIKRDVDFICSYCGFEYCCD